MHGRRQLGSLASRLEEYEQLLEELSLRAGDQDKAMIRKALDKVPYLEPMSKHSG